MKIRPDRRWWVLLGLLMLVAHASLFGVGPVGEDFVVLAEASDWVSPAPGIVRNLDAQVFYNAPGTAGRPLAALSLWVSTWLWTTDGLWTRFALAGLRLENIALLFMVAWALASVLRRLVSPWAGSEQANAGGQAAMMMLLVHPLVVTTVASPAARGDLIGALLALAAGAAFLRGRQEHSYGFVLLAAPLVALATLASELGFLVPFALAGAEYISSRRYRPVSVRVRTALTTLVCFGACCGLDVGLRVAVGVDPWPRQIEASLLSFTSFGELWVSLLSGLTKLGVLILPVNGANSGGMGFVLAALALVLVIQPALHAGKSAPRFWITALCFWLGGILVAEAVRAGLRVGPNDFSQVAGLFPAVIVMTMGLALASTAVSGGRRVALPLIVACLLCTLARSNARGWRTAAKEAGQLSEQMLPMVMGADAGDTFLVVDAPVWVDLFAACPEDLAWMFARAHSGQELPREQLRVRALSRESLMSFSRLEAFDVLRESGLVIVFPQHYVQPWATARWVKQRLGSTRSAGNVQSWDHFASTQGPRQNNSTPGHWADAKGRGLPFADPSGIECLTVETPWVPGEDAGEPEIYWRARGGHVRGGTLHGVWLHEGETRLAVFDPGSDLAWLLGHRVDSLLMMGELAEVRGADVWSAPPPVRSLLEPAVDGDDWQLGTPGRGSELGPGQEETWRLTLLDLVSLELEVVDCEIDGRGDLIAPDAEEISQGLRERPGSLAWAIERRVGTRVIERASGRL